MAQNLTFIATDHTARIRHPERQLIRSQCMRRKNKNPSSRRSKREAARAAVEHSKENQTKDGNSNLAPQPIPGALVTSHSKLFVRGWQNKVFNREYIPSFPKSDWALFEFPEELDSSSQKLMHQYYIQNPIRDILYPFKYFGVLVDFHEDPSWCFRTLCSEQLYFCAVLFLTSASHDLMERQQLSNTTRRHMQHLITVLNDRLSVIDAYKNDVILYVVSILASVAILFGEYKTASTHARGLSEIIRLRGGFGSDDFNPVIQLSIDRLNFSSSLVTELWTPLYDSRDWKAPRFPVEVMNLYRSEGMICIDNLIRPEVATVFQTIQYTSILVNKHYYEKTPVDGLFIRKCLGFVHSNLIELEKGLANELSECLRLAMMAFLATTFRLQNSYEHHYCKTLANRFQHSYVVTKAATSDLPVTIEIWLTLVLLISADSMCDHYAKLAWNAARGLTWTEIRIHLKRVMWIDIFHDDLGKRAIESLSSPMKSFSV